MKVKVLCDRCFKDVEHENVHKYGSAVYCSKCCEDIEKELSGEKYLIHVTEENQFNYRVHIETF